MKTIISALILLAILLPAALIAETHSIKGLWFDENKTSKIEIYQSTAGKFYGKINWLKAPNDAKGKPLTDKENPDPKLRNRPLIDLVILSGLVGKGGNKYTNGTIYDPESGKTYSCRGELTSENVLKLRGYIGLPTLGRSTVWTRATK